MKVWITDRWRATDRNTCKKIVRKANHGRGSRWQVSHYVHVHNWRSRVWNRAASTAGLGSRNLTPKALRHTAASMAIAAGADVKVVQRMLGHADAPMTLNTYADLWPDRLDEVIEAVSRHREEALRSAAS